MVVKVRIIQDGLRIGPKGDIVPCSLERARELIKLGHCESTEKASAPEVLRQSMNPDLLPGSIVKCRIVHARNGIGSKGQVLPFKKDRAEELIALGLIEVAGGPVKAIKKPVAAKMAKVKTEDD